MLAGNANALKSFTNSCLMNGFLLVIDSYNKTIFFLEKIGMNQIPRLSEFKCVLSFELTRDWANNQPLLDDFYNLSQGKVIFINC